MASSASEFGSGSPESFRGLGAEDVEAIIHQMVEAMLLLYKDQEKLVVVGVADGGIELARRIATELARLLKREVPVGSVNIAFHRDDLGLRPIGKNSMPTELPFSVDNQTVLLVDDVLFSGRTLRAAINEIFDQGRPECIDFAVLFDRGHRKLPFSPDFCGLKEVVDARCKVKVFLDRENPQADRITID